jgi:hypothetical protein
MSGHNSRQKRQKPVFATAPNRVVQSDPSNVGGTSFCPSYAGQRMAQTAPHLVEHVIPCTMHARMVCERLRASIQPLRCLLLASVASLETFDLPLLFIYNLCRKQGLSPNPMRPSSTTFYPQGFATTYKTLFIRVIHRQQTMAMRSSDHTRAKADLDASDTSTPSNT